MLIIENECQSHYITSSIYKSAANKADCYTNHDSCHSLCSDYYQSIHPHRNPKSAQTAAKAGMRREALIDVKNPLGINTAEKQVHSKKTK